MASKEYYQRNREAIKAKQAAYRLANLESTRAAVRKWRSENLEYAREKETV